MRYIFEILEAHWLTQCGFCSCYLKNHLKLPQPSVQSMSLASVTSHYIMGYALNWGSYCRHLLTCTPYDVPIFTLSGARYFFHEPKAAFWLKTQSLVLLKVYKSEVCQKENYVSGKIKFCSLNVDKTIHWPSQNCCSIPPWLWYLQSLLNIVESCGIQLTVFVYLVIFCNPKSKRRVRHNKKNIRNTSINVQFWSFHR